MKRLLAYLFIVLAYMDENVSQKAAEQGREQNPSLAGDPDKVLISYR